jgi:hypothetical protein
MAEALGGRRVQGRRLLRRISSAGIKPRPARFIIKTDDEYLVVGRAGGSSPTFEAAQQWKLSEVCRSCLVPAHAIFLIARGRGLNFENSNRCCPAAKSGQSASSCLPFGVSVVS